MQEMEMVMLLILTQLTSLNDLNKQRIVSVSSSHIESSCFVFCVFVSSFRKMSNLCFAFKTW